MEIAMITGATTQADKRVARKLLGYYVDGDHREIIQIEYRYSAGNGFTLFTRIQNQDYSFEDKKFFGAMSELLDRLPITSVIVIIHHVIVSHNGESEIVALEEWLRPYKIRNTGTVLYQLKFPFENDFIETEQYTEFGGFFGNHNYSSPAEELRARLGGDVHLRACYYCRYLVDYNDYGGTDYRHDQLYCFRDAPEALGKFEETRPKQDGREQWLSQGTPDMDALHSCSAFVYRKTPRP
jgi:hypothetical protein